MATILAQPLPTNHAFQVHVTKAASAAHQCMPTDNGRITRAVDLVLAGCVQDEGAGRWSVASATAFPERWHDVYHGTCTCKDFQYHGHAANFACSHLIATWLYRRAIAALEKEEIMSTPDNTCPTTLDHDGVPCHAVYSICPGHSLTADNTPLPPRLHADAGVTVAEVAALQAPAPAPEEDEAAAPERHEPCTASYTIMVNDHAVQIVLTDTDDFRLLCRIEAMINYCHRHPETDTEDTDDAVN